jgi:hypothetical protein
LTIDEQNRLMTTEYQKLGPLAWIRSDDRRLWMPMPLVEDAGGEERPVRKAVLDPATGLYQAKTIFEILPMLPKFQGGSTEPPIWCACRQIPVDESEWIRQFGSTEAYSPTQWIPIFTNAHQVIPLHLVSEPTEQDAWDMIYFLRSTADLKPGELSYEYRKAEERLRRKSWQENKYLVKQALGAFGRVNYDPGKRNAGVSFPRGA